MIRTIRGTVTHRLPQGVVIEVGGLGYLVSVPIRSIPTVGTDIALFTYHHIREDIQALYGFLSIDELNTFEALLTVPSIGPKLAMTILGAATPGDISTAVVTDNVGFFKSLPGVGGKSAAKIIVELRGKLGGSSVVSVPSAGADLIDALVALGYRPADLQSILKVVPAGLNLSQQVAWSLRQLSTPTRSDL